MAIVVKKLSQPVRIAYFLALLHTFFLISAIFSNSPTYDEPAHLAAGAAYWKYGAFNMYNLSPLFLRLLAAFPVMFTHAVIPPVDSFLRLSPFGLHWDYMEAFFYANAAIFPKLIIISRFVMIPISWLGMWITFQWSRHLYGEISGLAACALYALSPTIIANASLITTDVGTMVAMLAAVWLWWRFCLQPNRKRCWLVGLAIAVVHLCKFTAFFIWPTIICIAILMAYPRDQRGRLKILNGICFCVLLTIVLVNSAYGFRGSFIALGDYSFFSQSFQSLQQLLPSWLPVPLPFDYFDGFDLQKFEAEGVYAQFLFGQAYMGSKWYFYPAVLVCKLPVSILALLFLSVTSIYFLRHHRNQTGIAEISLLILPCSLLVGLTFFTNMHLGVRYLLPAFPLVFIFMSRLWSDSSARFNYKKPVTFVGTLLIMVLALECFSIMPRFLTFVNFAAGGPSKGYRLVNGSNYDWGQSLIELKTWMNEQSVERIQFAYLGSVDPRIYGIQYTPLRWPEDEGITISDEEYVAISSYFLVGIDHGILTPEGRTLSLDLVFFKQLQEETPVAIVGSTIFIYKRTDFINAKDRYQVLLTQQQPLAVLD